MVLEGDRTPYSVPRPVSLPRQALEAALRDDRRANIWRLLAGNDIPTPPAGIVPDYRGWAADLLRWIESARAAGLVQIEAKYRARPRYMATARALLDATRHQRLRLRAIAGGLRQP